MLGRKLYHYLEAVLFQQVEYMTSIAIVFQITYSINNKSSIRSKSKIYKYELKIEIIRCM